MHHNTEIVATPFPKPFPYFNRKIDTSPARTKLWRNFNLPYLVKVLCSYSPKQISSWRVKSFIHIDRSCSDRCGSFHINWRSFHANMLTERVTNMPTWVVITAICKFCDTSPLSLWKRRQRLHHTFWKLYVILLSSLSRRIGGIKFLAYPVRLLIKKTDFMAVVRSLLEWFVDEKSDENLSNGSLILI